MSIIWKILEIQILPEKYRDLRIEHKIPRIKYKNDKTTEFQPAMVLPYALSPALHFAFRPKSSPKSHAPRRHPFRKYRIPAFFFLLLLSRLRPLIFFTEWHFPFTPHFSKSYVLLAPGDVYTLQVGGFPTILRCESSAPLTASVTPGGIVHAWKCGKTVITAALPGKNGKKIRCLVHVTEPNKKSLTLSIGESRRIYLKGFFFGFGVKYKSSDSSIARVSSFGKVTAVKKGKAVITLTLKGKEFQCSVTVK